MNKEEGEKTSQVVGNYFRLPYLLNLNNSFLSQRGGKHVPFTQRGQRWRVHDTITHRTVGEGFLQAAAAGDQKCF